MTTLIKYLIQEICHTKRHNMKKEHPILIFFLGYPMQSQDRKHAKFSGVFIYQDLKQLKILIMQLPLLF